MVSFGDLDTLARSLPEVTIKPGVDGRPRYFVRNKMFAAHRDPRPDAVDEHGERLDDVLVFRVADEGVKFALIAARGDIFFTTPHFDGYSAVLSRISYLGQMDRTELREVVTDAWLSQAPKRLATQLLSKSDG